MRRLDASGTCKVKPMSRLLITRPYQSGAMRSGVVCPPTRTDDSRWQLFFDRDSASKPPCVTLSHVSQRTIVCRAEHASPAVLAGVQHRNNEARRRCAWTNYVTFLARFVVRASISIHSIHAQLPKQFYFGRRTPVRSNVPITFS
jgi:hypothetical protein